MLRRASALKRINVRQAAQNAQPAAITEYSDSLVRRLIETITICDEKLVIEFKAGLKTEVEI